MAVLAKKQVGGQVGIKKSVTRINELTPFYHPDQARFNHWFSYPWQGIEKLGPDRQWTTFHRKFYLSPDDIFQRWYDGDRVIGLRFGRETNYFVIDVDSYSAYHPDQSESNFQAIIGALDDLGISAPVSITSSFSGGLHLYGFLSEKVNSFNLALALTYALNQAGLQVKPGQLEIFPNVKQYSKEQFTLFNGHRLPLQPGKGSFILDDDLTAYADDLIQFLDLADDCAESVDMAQLTEVVAEARRSFSLSRFQRNEDGDRSNFYSDQPLSNKAKQWREDWEQILSNGFTGQGQTNNLLRIAVGYGIVFLGLTGAELRERVKETIVNAPGYKSFCNHQREIDRRIAESCSWYEKNGYFRPYCNYPERLSGIQFKPKGPTNEDRRLDAMERIADAVAQMQADGTLPDGITARRKVIAKLAKCSERTLIKHDYLTFWHPDHIEASNIDTVQDTAIPEKLDHTPPTEAKKNLSALELFPENRKIIQINPMPRSEKSHQEDPAFQENQHLSSICTTPGSIFTNKTLQKHTQSETQPFMVIKNVLKLEPIAEPDPIENKPFSLGDRVYELGKSHRILIINRIDDCGEWFRCLLPGVPKNCMGELFHISELLHAPPELISEPNPTAIASQEVSNA